MLKKDKLYKAFIGWPTITFTFFKLDLSNSRLFWRWSDQSSTYRKQFFSWWLFSYFKIEISLAALLLGILNFNNQRFFRGTSVGAYQVFSQFIILTILVGQNEKRQIFIIRQIYIQVTCFNFEAHKIPNNKKLVIKKYHVEISELSISWKPSILVKTKSFINTGAGAGGSGGFSIFYLRGLGPALTQGWPPILRKGHFWRFQETPIFRFLEVAAYAQMR